MKTNVQAASVWGWAFNFILAERWVFAKLKKKKNQHTAIEYIIRTPSKLMFCPTRYTWSLAENTPCPTATKAPITPFPRRLGLCLASTRVSRGSLMNTFRCYIGYSVQSFDLPVEHCQPHSRHQTTQWFHTVTHQESHVCTTSSSCIVKMKEHTGAAVSTIKVWEPALYEGAPGAGEVHRNTCDAPT